MNSFFRTFLEKFSAGEVVMVFDEHRENEGDFFCLAQYITPQKINFLMEKGKGMICTACSGKILDRLDLPLMVQNNQDPHKTNFCVTVDAAQNISTGVSAKDRSTTIKLLADPKAQRNDFTIPGHSFPLRAVSDLSIRFGHTEAAVGLAEKVGKIPVVAICEILNHEGEKASLEELKHISKTHNIPLVNLEQVKDFLTMSPKSSQ